LFKKTRPREPKESLKGETDKKEKNREGGEETWLRNESLGEKDRELGERREIVCFCRVWSEVDEWRGTW
jgi:hypothetical protein